MKLIEAVARFFDRHPARCHTQVLRDYESVMYFIENNTDPEGVRQAIQVCKVFDTEYPGNEYAYYRERIGKRMLQSIKENNSLHRMTNPTGY